MAQIHGHDVTLRVNDFTSAQFNGSTWQNMEFSTDDELIVPATVDGMTLFHVRYETSVDSNKLKTARLILQAGTESAGAFQREAGPYYFDIKASSSENSYEYMIGPIFGLHARHTQKSTHADAARVGTPVYKFSMTHFETTKSSELTGGVKSKLLSFTTFQIPRMVEYNSTDTSTSAVAST